MKALQAAKHACAASGWSLTNLQLQKIIYIAHMVYMGQTGRPLVDDEYFEAWDYGPVLPSVYRHVSGFGSRPIADVFATVEDSSDEAAISNIHLAIENLASIEPFQLVKILHDDRSAWLKCYDRSNRNAIISNEEVVDEFRRRFPQNTAEQAVE